MFKKHAYYLSLCLLVTPLVAMADDPLTDPPSPLPSFLAQLSSDCPALAAQLDAPTQQRLQAFYQQQTEVPIWSAGRLSALQAQLPLLADDGLDPARYPMPQDAGAGSPLCSDVEISREYLQALQDLHFGRLPQARFEPLWQAQPPARDANAELLALATTGLQDLAQAFDQARPNIELYRSLRRAYAAVRQQPLAHWSTIASGPLLRPGMEDARVPALAQRMLAEGYLERLPAGPEKIYGEELIGAVKHFQLSHSLQGDGVIGAGTLTELNISPALRREQLRINLERFRWLAPDLEPEGLLVNVAAAQLSFYHDGAPVWQTRLQVGRADRQTPLLKSRVTRLTLNPTWTVPPTIMREDKLPAIRQDPAAYLSQQNLQVLDSAGNPLAVDAVDWERPGNIMLRQGAGPRNPLGKIVLRFPNPFSVYLHDTPSQPLFAKGPRAFSSGCVRVEQPMHLRDLMLTPAERARTEELLASGTTHEYRLTAPVPILLGYWTVQVDSDGTLLYAPDIYGHDPVLLKALGAMSGR
ncbi:L,D-transpeptidase family protein [Pseudomonas gingeri]|uniref:L,D-transpeptidase family protein n=1 Tax=Pseudomonas gingeri TaxID=117681 RepID=UPI0015A11996|nr:L,D-transpeptidase family protein [Pseudomonas gingeri]NWA24659.1 L,D-transpeptidase family protein [Pseudomonas gingeri]NWD67274.1 L,D-transpeptidase family protein [Pseudomonas gingeri]NWD77957.1 L,D-transpeptidase family protein [Pseudomonas gingeri]